MALTKSNAKQLQRDFVPGGRSCRIETLRFRHTGEGDIFQCCKQTGNDLQSGAIFCGQIAEYVAPVENDGIVALCERHPPPKYLIDV